jgi:serine/threonine protein kinase
MQLRAMNDFDSSTRASSGSELRPGAKVGENLRLLRPLGQGGMGSVWVAEHLTLQTEVAVKFISAELTGQTEAVVRFQREATAAAQIKSPHVVQVFDHGVTSGGTPYIAMELLDGEELSKRLERAGALPVAQVAEIVTQLCRALSRAHALGIVHRDIKPENVFLVESDGDLLVKVLDFGIAKRTQESALGMTGTGMMIGTPYYMSPEQILSAKAVDSKSDLWAAAVVTYHMLTGALPFHEETLGGLCVAIERGVFRSPSSLRTGLPPEVDAWFARALARDPARRFATAKEMAEAFRAATGSVHDFALSGVRPAMTPHPAPVATLMEGSVTLARPKSRAPMFGALALAALVVMATLVLVAVRVISRTPSAPTVAEPASTTAPALSAPTPDVPTPPQPEVHAETTPPATSATVATTARRAPPRRAPTTKPITSSKPKTPPPTPTATHGRDHGF